jgi:hypothetical protein
MGIYQDLYVKRYFVGAKLDNLCAVASPLKPWPSSSLHVFTALSPVAM